MNRLRVAYIFTMVLIWLGVNGLWIYVKHNNKYDIFIVASIWKRAFRLSIEWDYSIFRKKNIKKKNPLNERVWVFFLLPCFDFWWLGGCLQNKSEHIPLMCVEDKIEYKISLFLCIFISSVLKHVKSTLSTRWIETVLKTTATNKYKKNNRTTCMMIESFGTMAFGADFRKIWEREKWKYIKSNT